ncbi:MAG TPA: class I SAM-dependent methyltransferase [Rhizomicrobium sp.]|nr:class I SAM-dependent methyltransferase [Rhizomicrobium sp.]
MRSAVRRAAHQVWDEPVVLKDPVALRIVGPEEEARLRRGRSDTAIERTIRAVMVARSRFAEDALAEAYARGVRQYVVLGAGLDTFAYRNPWPDLKVYEVDHPASQAYKKEQLAKSGIAVPGNCAFVPVDFMRQTPAGELPAAGWNAGQPTFFSWLGVTPYLTREAVLATLSFVAACPRGSGIVFDVSTPDSHVSLRDRVVRMWVVLRNAARSEPTVTRFDPKTLAADAAGLGFSDTGVFAADTVNARYFAGRRDGLAMSRRSALISASV